MRNQNDIDFDAASHSLPGSTSMSSRRHGAVQPFHRGGCIDTSSLRGATGGLTASSVGDRACPPLERNPQGSASDTQSREKTTGLGETQDGTPAPEHRYSVLPAFVVLRCPHGDPTSDRWLAPEPTLPCPRTSLGKAREAEGVHISQGAARASLIARHPAWKSGQRRSPPDRDEHHGA